MKSPAVTPSVEPTAAASSGTLLLIGRIVTMADPAEVEAVLIVNGRVLGLGKRDEVAALAPPGTPVVELGSKVAYPGFIDAHSHWIGDREFGYGPASAQDAMAAAARRGWTSIAELWVHRPRLETLEQLDAARELLVRVDAYLALSDPEGNKFGDWYADLAPGPRSDFLRIAGLKIHLDWNWGAQVSWAHDELGDAIERANDRGWQVAVHTVSTKAHNLVLDAYERALDGGPNELHHRIEHAFQVTDEQLARMVKLDAVVIIHTNGSSTDWSIDPGFLANLNADPSLLGRWRDFIDAGLHVASAVDAPWLFPEMQLSDGVGRAVDQVAGGMDGRGNTSPNVPDWVLRQLLTSQQGLARITTDAAYALNDEANRGHLARGTFGDVTVLSGDITAGTPDDIRSLEVVATIVGGRTVYCGDLAVC